MTRITIKQAKAIHSALSALLVEGITGTQIEIISNGTTSTVWACDAGIVYMLVETQDMHEYEYEFSSLSDFLASFK